ncbi:PBP1A family penicillin-binding protein [Candidatus Uhrbacteria bacterium]|nr:PBP1A family penicillin-binding protein [Candidatus Uhrbacteria bacterium]
MTPYYTKSPRRWRSHRPSRYKNFPSYRGRRSRLAKTLATIVIISGIAGVLALALAMVWVSRALPNPDRITTRKVAESTKIYDRTGKVLLYEIHGGEKRTRVKLSDLPSHVKWATIVAEDDAFYQHGGIDIKGILRSVLVDILHGGKVQGGSTITQQFIKNSVLTNEKTYARKLKEIILAFEIERRFSKDQILEMYLNEIGYGGATYGIEAASNYYFGKSAKDLSIAQAALVASLPKAPTYYSPYGKHVDELLGRRDYVLGRLYEKQYITKDEYDKAKKDPIGIRSREENLLAPHFVLWVRDALTDRYGEKLLEEGGLKVTTTLDMDKQKIAEEAITNIAKQNEKSWQAKNAALVALDAPTGQVLSMVGSRDYFDTKNDGNVNVALRPRQPGSSFKPIVYSAAFEKGYTPETLLWDVVTTFPTDIEGEYIPHNYDDKEHGVVSMRQALAGSLNIPAVKTIYLTGLPRVLDLAERLGYSTLNDHSRFGLSLVLGGGEVTLLDPVSAFSVFAQEGVRHPVVSILKVEDRDGKTLEEWKADAGSRVVNENIARLTTSILSDNDARAYIFGQKNYLTLPDRPVAAKTGTTNDYHDAWTIGYTPSLVAGVWVGNNNNAAMKKGADGSKIAAPIWNTFMQKSLAKSPKETFTPPLPNDAEKPILRGVTMGAHDILQFVDKDNPRGPVPTDPGRDPYYESWEKAVQEWLAKNNATAPENMPTLTVDSPVQNATVARGVPLPIRITATAKRGIRQVEYSLDDKLLFMSTASPFSFEKFSLAPDTTPGTHTLTIRAMDDVGNSAVTAVTLLVQ